MHHYSIFELFSIGIGPSSSHTVGPMRAAHRFLEQIRHSPRLPEITGIRCECYGSLAATGHGHGTDTAIMLGLLGEEPHTVEPRSIPGKIARLHQQETLPVTEEKTVRFSPTRDLDLSHYQPLRLHPNGMLFTAVNQEGEPVEDAVFYSTGAASSLPSRSFCIRRNRTGSRSPSPMNPRKNCCAWRMNGNAPSPPSSWPMNAPCFRNGKSVKS